MKVDENCMMNVSVRLVYFDWSSLLSAIIWLKYHKKTHLPNNSARGVVRQGNRKVIATMNQMVMFTVKCTWSHRFLWFPIGPSEYNLWKKQNMHDVTPFIQWYTNIFFLVIFCFIISITFQATWEFFYSIIMWGINKNCWQQYYFLWDAHRL